jgi:hypothetical protein
MAVVYTPYIAAENRASASPHHVCFTSAEPGPPPPPSEAEVVSEAATHAAPATVSTTPTPVAREGASRRKAIDSNAVKTHDVEDSTVEEARVVPASDALYEPYNGGYSSLFS